MIRQRRTTSARHPLRPALGGLVFSVVGIVMAADQLDCPLPHRWTALVLVFPGSAAVMDCIRLIVFQGGWNIQILAHGLAGLLFVAIGVFLFQGINTGLLLPCLMIVIGLTAFARALARRSLEE